jgi:hypothetical protein
MDSKDSTQPLNTGASPQTWRDRLENLSHLDDESSGATGGSTLNPVERLRTVTKEQLIALLEKKDEIDTSRRVERSEEITSAGVYTINDDAFIAMPENVYEPDCELGILLADLVVTQGLPNVQLKMLAKDDKFFTDLKNGKFILGLLHGLTTDTPKMRVGNKKDFDLGCACAYSLRVKHYFNATPIYGSEALVADHAFFGNSKKDMSGRAKEIFILKDRLASFVSKNHDAKALLQLMNFLAKKLLLDNHSQEDLEKTISANIKPFSEVMLSLYPRRDVQVSKKKIEKQVMKPSIPKSSPLFLREEMQLIVKLLRPSYSDIGGMQENYIYYVATNGFDDLRCQLQEKVLARRKICQDFGRVSKARFSALQESTKKTGLRRNEVSSEMLRSYIQTIDDPVSELVRSIGQLLSPKILKRNVEIAFNKRIHGEANLQAFLLMKSFGVYSTVLPNSTMAWRGVTHLTMDNFSTKRLREAIDYIMQIDICIGKINIQSDVLHRIPDKFVEKHLEGICKNVLRINDLMAMLTEMQDDERDSASKAASNSNKRYETVIDNYRSLYTLCLKSVNQRIRVSLFTASEESKASLNRFKQTAETCRLIPVTLSVTANH